MSLQERLRHSAEAITRGIEFGHDWPNTQDELDRTNAARKMQEAAAELDRLQARVAELEVDAERLNSGAILLGDRDDFGEPYTRLIIGLDLRAAIDTARKAKP